MAALSRGVFAGLCYVCGVQCGHTYCHEHKHLARFMAMPYRPDRPNMTETVPIAEMDRALRTLEDQQRRLDAWRRLYGADKRAA